MTEHQEQPVNEQPVNKQPGRKGGPLGILQTILGAVFGVQSDKKRQEDFTKADPGKMIAVGIITVVVIMLTMVIVVRSVLP